MLKRLPVAVTSLFGYLQLKELLSCMVMHLSFLICQLIGWSQSSMITGWITNFILVSRTAGLPQYGQLGHGTDNEVFWVIMVLLCYSGIYSMLRIILGQCCLSWIFPVIYFLKFNVANLFTAYPFSASGINLTEINVGFSCSITLKTAQWGLLMKLNHALKQ